MFDPSDYPSDWKRIRAEILGACMSKCMCAGECGQHSGACPAVNHELHPSTGSLVVLTIAHLCRTPCAAAVPPAIKCGERSHLKAMCQRCHLAFDLPHHIARRRRSRFEKKAAADLFDGEHAMR
jgi:hypothetical protein